MSKTAIHYIEMLAVIGAVALSVHYLAVLDWPWAIVSGAAASLLLQALVHSRTPPPTTGERG